MRILNIRPLLSMLPRHPLEPGAVHHLILTGDPQLRAQLHYPIQRGHRPASHQHLVPQRHQPE